MTVVVVVVVATEHSTCKHHLLDASSFNLVRDSVNDSLIHGMTRSCFRSSAAPVGATAPLSSPRPNNGVATAAASTTTLVIHSCILSLSE